MLFTTSTGLFKFSWDSSPTVDGVFSPVSSTRGALNKRVLVEVEGVVYGMDRSGWWKWEGVFPTHLSDAVDELLTGLDFDNADRWHAAWYPGPRVIRWYVSQTGDAYPRDYVQLDVDTGAWGTGTSNVGISESRLVLTPSGLKTYLGDENGRVWEAERGRSDGTSWLRLERLTAENAALGTVVRVTQALPTIERGLQGYSVYSPNLNASAEILSNTTYDLQLSKELLVGEGDVLWLGRIDARLKTRAFGQGFFSQVKRYRYLHLAFDPSGKPGRILARIYHDLSSSERTDYGRLRLELDGISEPGRDDARVGVLTDAWAIKTEKADGYVRVPFSAEFVRQLEIQIEAGEPGVSFLAVGIGMDGEGVERAAD